MERWILNPVVEDPPVVIPPEGENMGFYNCEVIRDTKVRKNSSIWSAGTGRILRIGEAFNAVEVLVKQKTLLPPEEAGVWLMLEDGTWTAAEYKGVEFVQYVDNTVPTPDPEPEPPVVTDPSSPTSVVLNFSSANLYDKNGVLIGVCEGGEITLKVI